MDDELSRLVDALPGLIGAKHDGHVNPCWREFVELGSAAPVTFEQTERRVQLEQTMVNLPVQAAAAKSNIGDGVSSRSEAILKRASRCD